MTISADINKQISDQVFAIYSNAESLMLEKVANRIKKGATNSGWNERKLEEMTKMRKELEAITNDLNKIASSTLSKAIKDSYQKGINSAEKDFKLPKTILSETHVPAKLQRLVQQSNNIVVNSSFKILRNTEDAYRRIQAEVTAGTLTGVETRKQIARKFLNKLADNGITSFVDKRGRNWEMGAYAEMVTRTTTIRASMEGHIDRQLEAGRDLIVISDHAGECPLCRPWENKVLSITGKDSNYPSLATAQAAGLFHPNCKHTLTGYIEGLTDLEPHPRTSGVPEQYKYIEQQRSNERAIRRWKRREIVAIDNNDKHMARENIRDYQFMQRALLKEFEKRFGMTTRRKYDRESILNRVGIAGKEKELEWTKIGKSKIKAAKVEKKVKSFIPKLADYKSWQGRYKGRDFAGLNSAIPDVVEHAKYLEARPELNKAINYYSTAQYSNINAVLRNGRTFKAPEVAETADILSKMGDFPPLSENVIIYRHSKISSVEHMLNAEAKEIAKEALTSKGKLRKESVEKLRAKYKNVEILDKAALSTSYEPNVFTKNDGFEMRILTPKGFKNGVFTEAYSESKSEAEFLFKPNQKFKIIDIEVRETPHGYNNISFLVYPIE